MLAAGQPAVCVAHGGILRCAFRMFGGLSQDEAATMPVPQDRVVLLDGDTIRWL